MFSHALGFAAPAVPAPSESVKDERPAKDAEISNETPVPGGAPAEVRFTLTEIRVEHDRIPLSDEKLSEISSRYLNREITGNQVLFTHQHYSPTELFKKATEKALPAEREALFLKKWGSSIRFYTSSMVAIAFGRIVMW